MYQPAHFQEDRLEVQHELIRRQPLGMLVSGGGAGLTANPVPFLLVAGEGPRGVLRCHVARANPQWKQLEAAPDCLVVFQGADHYVTPSWYATKRETGKVVPTWNYAIVQARGRATVIQDAAWLRTQIEALTNSHEGNRSAPWAVGDAPEPYIAAQMRGIVGIEIPIDHIDGKWKVSQNRPAADRAGVVNGLEKEGTPGLAMAELVRERASRTAGRPD